MKKLAPVFLWLMVFAFAASLLMLSACDQSYNKAGIKPCETCPTAVDGGGSGGGDDDDDNDTGDDDDDTTNTDSEIYIAGGDDTEGLGFVALKDNDGWNVEYGPIVEGTDGAIIRDIALNSATTGYAITTGGLNAQGQLLELSAGAKGWNWIEFDHPGPEWLLEAVTAPAADVAYVVGWVDNSGAPFILAYDGTEWDDEALGTETEAELKDVAAVATGNAWTVGYADDEEPGLWERSEGAWSRLTLPSGYDGELMAVAAEATVKADVVYAVGNDVDNYVYYDGSDWSVESFPVKKEKYPTWNDVDVAGGVVAVVGEDEILIYDGGWTYYNPSLSFASYDLKKVTVIDGDNIYAVGEGDDGTKANVGVVIYFNGTDWSEIDLTGTGLESEDFRAVDFYDENHGYFGGADGSDGFVIDYTSQAFGTAANPVVPLPYYLNGIAVNGDDIYATGQVVWGDPVILENTAKAWTVVTDLGALLLYDIASTDFGTFAVGSAPVDGNALWEKDGTWSAVELTGHGDIPVLYAIAANDTQAAVGGWDENGPMLYTGSSDGWSMVTLPEVSGVTDIGIMDVAINGETIWAVATGDMSGTEVGVIYQYQADEEKAKGWSTLDLGITGDFAWNAVSADSSGSTDYVTFAGRSGEDSGPYMPLVYKIDGDNDPEEVEVKDESENNWKVVDLSAFEDNTYALCSEEIEGGFYRPILISRGNFWGGQNLSSLPEYITGGAIFYREVEAAEEE